MIRANDNAILVWWLHDGSVTALGSFEGLERDEVCQAITLLACAAQGSPKCPTLEVVAQCKTEEADNLVD